MDREIVLGRHFDAFDTLSETPCYYRRRLMNQYTEVLWQTTIQNRLQQMGERRSPRVSTQPIPLPLETDRETEVLVLSLCYKQNLLNSFLYLSQRQKCPSPLCKCLGEEQTAYHLLVSCNLVDWELRSEMDNLLYTINGGDSTVDGISADYISILNCSRDSEFVLNCIKIVKLDVLQLRKKYIVSY